MTDIFNKDKRSEIMGLIKGKNTKPEIVVRKFLHSIGYRFRLFDKNLPCHPDIVLKKYKTVIFVNGCFWHGHQSCKYFKLPKSNIEFWKNKIEANRKRDQVCLEKIHSLGWDAITIWECELNKGKLEQTLSELDNALQENLKSQSKNLD
jgi:DNA mismatch endonuclease (patch repair protein)